ncbi:MAG: hypothetical protein ACFFBP_17840 [Promethearchaeota archaeon]
MNHKILYVKANPPNSITTEGIALNVLNNDSYDNNPLINKEAIIKAFNQYGKELNPLNKEVLPALTNTNVNIEGNFIAENIPEIPNIVINEECSKKKLYDILDKNSDITHIALSTYAFGMENSIEIINTIKKEFSHIELLVGGIGSVYSHIQRLIPPNNLCIGEGVNFIRKKFGLKLLAGKDFKIPKIFGNVSTIPISMKAAYMVTQLGCPHNCNFCITPNFYNYLPFSNREKIISFFEELISTSKKDIFVYLCDPNGFYPEQIWRDVFDYFLKNYKETDKNIFIFGLASLEHINKFNIENIQQNSPMKFIGISYGIESTLYGGYAKNKDIADKVIERLNKNGIITFHTCIIGLPIHTRQNIIEDINNNINLKSDIISINTFKPIPKTIIYKELNKQNRILIEDLPPEFLYMEGYMPFKHPNLGFGFDILPYAFKAYYECEKKIIDVYSNLADKIFDLYSFTNSRKLKSAFNVLIELSKKNFESFKTRMPIDITQVYRSNLDKIIEKTLINKKR